MVSTPISWRRLLSPTPEIWSSCGVCSAPAARMASALTPTVDLAAEEDVVNCFCYKSANCPHDVTSSHIGGRGTHLDARDLGGAVGAVDDQLRHLLAGDEVQVGAVLGGRVVGLARRAARDGRGVDVVRAVVAADGRAGGLVGGDGDAELVGGVDDVFWGAVLDCIYREKGGGGIWKLV